ncbi:cytochrome P450 3A24-like [Lycorma delicatula]|uniref:cytochrome P450 3A24-like n=1 Tax=Lycorma delicatula TaxID=130591 RepID=UPI003F514E2A
MEVQLLAVIFTALALSIAFIYRFITAKFNYFAKQGINGPKPSFPFGTWNGAWKKDLGEDDLENIQKHGKVYGTFDGRTPNLIVADPSLIKKLLEDDADKFQSYRASRVKQSVLHNSLLHIEGKESKELRKVLNIAFSGGKIKKLFPRISQTSATLTQHLVKSVGQESSINISQYVSNYINDTIAFSIFGLDLNADETVHQRFYKAVNNVFVVDNPDSLLSVTPFIFESLGSLDNFVLRPAAAKYLTGLSDLVIEEKKTTSDVKPEGRAVDFVDLLLAAAEEEKQLAAKEKGVQEENLQTLLTKDQLITLCMEVILTVGRAAKSSLALSIHTLASNPDIQENLYKEITKQLLKFEEISYEFIQEFDYLDMFLGEILRIFPVEYRLERKCIEEVVWGETKITPGVLVSVPLFGVHKSAEFYSDPEKFKPERFSAENSEKRNLYTYLPFGQVGATSTNIGVELGVLFTKLAIVTLINALKFIKTEETKEPAEFVKGITGVPSPKPIWLKIEKRD